MNNRHERIKEILLEKKRVEVNELSDKLGVSEVTIRKDLDELENQGFLLRRYGGAILAENPHHVINYLKKIDLAREEKQKIAQSALSIIKEDENIFLDAGSTTLELAHLLSRFRLRVVTNSLPISDVLADTENIVLDIVGGTLRKASGALIGPRTCKALDGIFVDKLFLGCSGFDVNRGFSSENAVEAETKNKLLSCSGTRIILADHEKFERPAFANFAGLDEIDMVITDRKLSDVVNKTFKKHNIKVVCK